MTVDLENQNFTLKGMGGTDGALVGVKLASVDASSYEGMTFSFDLGLAATGTNFTYSLWFETQDGSALQITQGNRTGTVGQTSISYDFTSQQLTDMATEGPGALYVVFANRTADANTATVGNASLTATEKAIPEPSTSALGLLGLAGFMLRRRRQA